jgi:cytoskeletal protein RodZ
MADEPQEPQEPPRSSEAEDRDRKAREHQQANIMLLVGAVVFIAIGVWLVNAMLDARRADECMSSGRRNCAPIETPQR